jgi:Protein of unknown function (DUF2585)
MADSLRSYLIQNSKPLYAIAFVFAAVITIEANFEGHVWWCQTGDYVPWAWNIWSPHNSQHLVDPYSFTHILHGMLEFWLLGLLFPKLPVAWRLVIAIIFEGTWEIVENTSDVINRYREETLAMNYYGDSIINSASDVFCCGIGFLIGYKLRFWKSLVLFVTTEAVLIVWIHDSLLINIVMLIYPIEAIKKWQMGG